MAQALADNGGQSGVPQRQHEGMVHEESDGSSALKPLLMPKFQPPRLPTSLVRRSRLLAQFEAGYESKLILISAPAGFGKTTLARQWLDEAAQRQALSAVAWLANAQQTLAAALAKVYPAKLNWQC